MTAAQADTTRNRSTQDRSAEARSGQAGSRGALALQDLSWHIGGLKAVDAVTLDVNAGELLAVIGPNGAGKTTLFNLITGLIRPTAGTIALDGRDITRLAAHRRVPLGLGRTFQTSSVFGSMTVRENVELAAQASMSGPYRSLRIWARISADAKLRADDALRRTRLAAHADALAGSLSHGGKRKLELAILLAGDASVVLLDEPMAGMAIEEVPELTELIRDIHRAGATVLMVEHHMEVVLGLADRVAVLHHGELIACGTASEVTADVAVRQAYMGEPL
jgi:branched-chain amino acid transport system ATP-binding protein